MQELFQLYNENGKPLQGKGATKEDVYEGLLHGAAHVWIWRKTNKDLEILVQRRAPGKQTWPNMLDISAAGHIDLGETPEDAAIRESKEEIGIDISPSDMNLIKVHRGNVTAPDGSIENEFKWMYAYELKENKDFNLQTSEVSDLQWVGFDEFKQDIFDDTKYVPQGKGYAEALVSFYQQLR